MRLLYKDKKNIKKIIPDDIAEALVLDLELEKLAKRISKKGKNNFSGRFLIDILTDNTEEIKYRQEISKNLIENNELCKQVEKICNQIMGLDEVVNDMTSTLNKELTNYLIVIKWLDLYCSLITNGYNAFKVFKEHINSIALKKMGDSFFALYNSEEFKIIKNNVKLLNPDCLIPNSMKIGVNINEYWQPVSLNCLEINEYYYYPRKMAEFNKNDGKNHGIGKFRYLPDGKLRESIIQYDELKAKTAMVNTTKIQKFFTCKQSVEYIIGINTFFKALNFNSRNSVKKFILSKTNDLLELYVDLEFILGGINLAKELEEKGMPICIPEVKESNKKEYIVEDLYNCYLPFLTQNPRDNIVLNDLSISETSAFAVLNGPNKGGKTTFVQAMCISIIMFQLGMYIPCSKASISPVDMIITHYQREESNNKEGRLASEAASIRNIFRKTTKNSMVIFNEPYVSTSPTEGMYLIMNLISGIRELECRGFLVTHYHKLNDEIELENKNRNNKISFFNMGIEKTNITSRRTYELKVGRGEVKSFAMDILREYAPDLLK